MKTFLMCAFFTTQLICAQETIPSSGGEAAGIGGSASYTIGQLVYTSTTNPSGSLQQGINRVSNLLR